MTNQAGGPRVALDEESKRLIRFVRERGPIPASTFLREETCKLMKLMLDGWISMICNSNGDKLWATPKMGQMTQKAGR
jgi:hypothetical protein